MSNLRVDLVVPLGGKIEISEDGVAFMDAQHGPLWGTSLRDAERLFAEALRTVQVFLEVHDPHRPRLEDPHGAVASAARGVLEPPGVGLAPPALPVCCSDPGDCCCDC